jgi:cell division septation protein DedD
MSLIHGHDEDDDVVRDTPDRELTLSTGAILAVFVGLVLLCGFFFGLGYTIRGRQQPKLAMVPATDSSANTSSNENFDSFKPAAGSPRSVPAAPPTEDSSAIATPSPATTVTPTPPPAPKEVAPVVHPAATKPVDTVESSSAPTVAPPGSFFVQVAAVSHAEDAKFVVSALRAKGYPAAARTESQDKLLHIQVGPYATRKDADVVKQHLTADGYANPIVK